MLKTQKKLSLFLCILFVASTLHPGFAIETTNVFDPDFEQIYEVGTRLLSDIESEKAMYGLSDVNFSNLCIGEYIPAYTATASGLIQSYTRYYPILEDGVWTATLTCVKSGNIWNGQISTAFVSELPVISSDDNLRLIFDRSKAYLNKNDNMYEIASFNPVSNRNDIASTPATLSVLPAQKLTSKCPVEIDRFNNTQVYSSVPIQKFLDDMPLVSQQPYTYACWAACSKAIVQYYKSDCTIDQVYEAAEVTKYQAGYLVNIKDALYGLMGLNTEMLNYGITFDYLHFGISDNYPIAAIAYPSAQDGDHAVVIYGYVKYTNSSYAGSVSYMDPMTSSGSYASGSVSANNVFTYIDPYGDVNGTINEFGIVRDFT